MRPGLAEGALVGSPAVVGEVANGAGICDRARVRTLARKKKKELQGGERQGKEERREEEKADFRRVVHTSQPEWAPHEKNEEREGRGRARAAPANRRGGPKRRGRWGWLSTFGPGGSPESSHQHAPVRSVPGHRGFW